MRISIRVEISDARQWLIRLRDALRDDGHFVQFRIFGEERSRDAAISTLKAFELAMFGAGKGLWARGNLDHITPQARDDQADLTIALSPGGGGPVPGIVLVLDGKPGVSAAMPNLLQRRVPFVECRGADGALLAAGLPAIESPDVIVQALDDFYIRLVTLIRIAVRAFDTADHGARESLGASLADGQAHRFGFASLGRRLWRRLMRQHRLDDHWRVGIRPRLPNPPVSGDAIIEGFAWLPDDGKRYYADPILFTHGGRDFLFVEEFPSASRRGAIAVCELDAQGSPVSPPQRVIESAGHMSYPFVFAHDGQVWMIPENAAERHLPIYRARRFPDVWELHGSLIAGMGLHDATLLPWRGRWWLLANTEEDGGSSWDCLSAFVADTPLGPFERVGAGPLLVDARYARSAGPVIEVGGRLVRPVQSCLGHYGRFLRFLAIDEVSAAGIVQHETGRLLAPLGTKAAGVHTYGINDRFEVIDAFGL